MAGEPVGPSKTALVVGRGRLGSSLRRALAEAGIDCALVSGRDAPAIQERLVKAPVAIVFLAVPDPAIEPTAAAIAEGAPPAGPAFVHLSGAHGLAPLRPLADLGSAVGAFHPLQSFPAERGPEAFVGSMFGINASRPELLDRLQQLAAALGGTARLVPDGDRALYHAAAVIASNYLNSLAAEAARVLAAIGWSREESVSALLPLLRGAVENLEVLGLPGALIGPIRRGDGATVARHLRALGSLPGDRAERTRRLYLLLGAVALELALEAGLDPEEGAQVAKALQQ